MIWNSCNGSQTGCIHVSSIPSQYSEKLLAQDVIFNMLMNCTEQLTQSPQEQNNNPKQRECVNLGSHLLTGPIWGSSAALCWQIRVYRPGQVWPRRKSAGCSLKGSTSSSFEEARASARRAACHTQIWRISFFLKDSAESPLLKQREIKKKRVEEVKGELKGSICRTFA